MFGLTAALWGEITIKNGRVEQHNFNDYRMLRIHEAPAIEVHLVNSGEAPGGIGEAGTSAIAPAGSWMGWSDCLGSYCLSPDAVSATAVAETASAYERGPPPHEAGAGAAVARTKAEGTGELDARRACVESGLRQATIGCPPRLRKTR